MVKHFIRSENNKKQICIIIAGEESKWDTNKANGHVIQSCIVAYIRHFQITEM